MIASNKVQKLVAGSKRVKTPSLQLPHMSIAWTLYLYELRIVLNMTHKYTKPMQATDDDMAEMNCE